MRPGRRALAVLGAWVLSTVCSAQIDGTAIQAKAAPLGDMAALGRQIFFDTSLSASGRQSCASCHDPASAYTAPNGLAVQLGGARLQTQGLRAVPSLRYVLARTPRWFKQYQADPVEREIDTDSVPTGGFTRDGRFDTLHDQARAPLFDRVEMGNTSDAELARKLRRAPYGNEFHRLFGVAVMSNDAQTVKGLQLALERFELEDSSFHPFNSRFDQYLRGQISLSPQEARGLKIFSDPNKGNCASCHTVTPGADGSPPLLTDFSFAALGVPHNVRLKVNADPTFFDEGLCGPLRRDAASQNSSCCGMFKTPSLRNVATRKSFMHNGAFKDLESAVRLYATRDVSPELWYPRRANGQVDRFNDLPMARRNNVDQITVPMNRKPGQAPAFSDEEASDIVAFLRTLTDEDAKKDPR